MRNIKANETNTLKGQMQLNIHVTIGVNTFRIKVLCGKIRINHGTYTPDGGTWLSSPNGRTAHYDFIEGEDGVVTIDIQKSFGKCDILSVVNPFFFKTASFIIYKI